MYNLLADLLLICHAGIVAFNLFSLPVIIIGRLFRREFVHNPWFRYSHLASMGLVLVLAVFNRICPLTEWEWRLRTLDTAGNLYRETKIQQWVGGLIYYDLSWSTATAAYCIWFIVILIALWLVPVHRQHRSHKAQ